MQFICDVFITSLCFITQGVKIDAPDVINFGDWICKDEWKEKCQQIFQEQTATGELNKNIRPLSVNIGPVLQTVVQH